MSRLIRAAVVGGGGSTVDAAVRSLWGPLANGFGLGGGTSITTISLNDSDNSIASVFQVEKSGTIDRIGVHCTAVTGSPNLNVGLVTLDASGNPTTTGYGGSAVKSVTSWSAGFAWVTLDTPATATAGDRVAARIWPNGGANVPSGSHFITAYYRHSLLTNLLLPHPQDWATAWTKNTNYPCVAVRYSDDTVGPIIPLTHTTVTSASLLTAAYNTGTSPDEIGNLLQVPFAATCIGARLYLDPAAGGDCTARLYNAADTVLKSATLTVAELAGVNGGVVDVFWAPQTLAADTDYRLTLLPGTATSVQMGQVMFQDADSRNRLPEGARWHRTSRSDAGAWDDSLTLVVPLMGLWLSGMTVPD